MAEYVVIISNVFEAENHVDAVEQMVSYLVESASIAGYRVESWPDASKFSRFLDAEDINSIADALRKEGSDLWDATEEQIEGVSI